MNTNWKYIAIGIGVVVILGGGFLFWSQQAVAPVNETVENEREQPEPIVLDVLEWKIGESHAIMFNTEFGEGCLYTPRLIEAESDNLAGYIVGYSRPGAAEMTWDARTVFSISCGTGAEEISVQPGTYKVRMYKPGSLEFGPGAGQEVVVDSEPFSIIE